MKTLTKSFLLGIALLGSFLGLLFLTASAASAADTRPAKDEHVAASVRYSAYTSWKSETVNINVEKPAGEAVTVEFLNEDGKVLAQQRLSKRSKGTFGLKFNVANLEDGNYSVRIVGGQTNAAYQVTLTTGSVTEPVRMLSMQ